MNQLGFTRGRGGRRPGAGRKPLGERRNVPHRPRPVHDAHHPVFVTMRSAFRSLRTRFAYPTIRGAVAHVNRRRRATFRVVHYSVQSNHLHLIVEASDRRALSAGIKSLAITLALRVNRLAMRRGPVFADRWHGRALETPRAVRRAIVYVLANFRKHERGAAALVDIYSSAPFFAGFRELGGVPPILHARAAELRVTSNYASAVEASRTWLLNTAWRRNGLIGLREAPASSPP